MNGCILLAKNPYIQILLISLYAAYFVKVYHVTSLLVPNLTRRRYGNISILQNKNHITSSPTNIMNAMKALQTIVNKKDIKETNISLPLIFKKKICEKKSRSNVEKKSILEPAKAVLPRISLLSVLVVDMSKKRLFMLTTSFVLLSATVFSSRVRKILYPGISRDESFEEPLPPGTLGGCPFMGEMNGYNNLNSFMSKASAKIGNPKIWKMYFAGTPAAILSGSKVINKMLDKEFRSSNGIVSQVDSLGDSTELIFGKNSMSSVLTDRKEYHFQRKLVGASLKPQALVHIVPFLQEAAEKSADQILSSAVEGKNSIMVDVCKDFTFAVTCRQIMGLNLKDDERMEFYQAVTIWLSAVSNYLIYFLPKIIMKHTKGHRAKKYLDLVLERKMDSLEKNGPDGSTLSSMLFNTDDDDADTDEANGEKRHLSREQVIDNTLLLILAGTETSSNTLTNAMQLLGMHPHVWDKIVEEQTQLVSLHGKTLNKQQIDKECPYLESVIKEVMRLVPFSAGGARNIDDTIVIDGVQVPKGWRAWYSISLTHEQDPVTFKEDGSHMDIWKGFQPERWLNDSTRPTTEYLPFGAGNRFCLGWALAMLEMQIFLAVLARKIQYQLVHEPHTMKWKEGFILTPKDGCEISAHST